MMMESARALRTEEVQLFHRQGNPFHEVDESKPPSSSEGEEELETNVDSLKGDIKLIAGNSVQGFKARRITAAIQVCH